MFPKILAKIIAWFEKNEKLPERVPFIANIGNPNGGFFDIYVNDVKIGKALYNDITLQPGDRVVCFNDGESFYVLTKVPQEILILWLEGVWDDLIEWDDEKFWNDEA